MSKLHVRARRPNHIRCLCLRLTVLLAAFVLAAGPAAPARAAGDDTPTRQLPPAGDQQSARSVTIYSSLDAALAQPLLTGFQRLYPEVGLRYFELQTQDIHTRIIDETNRGVPTADLAFSSAMDLQVKLANDGYAQAMPLRQAASIPDWAHWRDTVYGVTFEPAVILYHKPAFAGREPPRTRAALTRYLKANEASLYGRVGTYDVERAGLGLFFLARDREHNKDIWELFGALGAAGVKLYSNSSAIVERVADGRFVLGYNILGSYAAAWARSAPDLGIILPEDYTVVMSRTGLVPRNAAAPDLGAAFLDFMLSREGQQILAETGSLAALRHDLDGPNTASSLRAEFGDRLRPVPVGPALVVYLDQVKRQRLIDRWNRALRIQ